MAFALSFMQVVLNFSHYCFVFNYLSLWSPINCGTKLSFVSSNHAPTFPQLVLNPNPEIMHFLFLCPRFQNIDVTRHFPLHVPKVLHIADNMELVWLCSVDFVDIFKSDNQAVKCIPNAKHMFKDYAANVPK